MGNKLIIGILIFLVILSGSLCFCSYTLYTEINSLSRHLTALQEEQAVRIESVSNELTIFRTETAKEFGILQNEIQSEIDRTLTRVETLKNDMGENLARIDVLEDKSTGNTARIDTMKIEVEKINTDFSQSAMNATEVYQRARNSTVRISDGERIHGSGFIFDDKAHVVTAQHVVENMSTIYVVLPDGRISMASKSSGCKYSDVAVLTLKDELVIDPLPLADSTTVKIGEPVATIGNPFAITETLTTGIVSQKDRFVEIKWDSQTRWVANLIQFDAAVNSGNSGCPLFDIEGEVIGMVIARVLPDEGEGINYAVSSNKIKRVAASLIAKGYFEYPWLGINVANLTPQIAETRGVPTVNGVLVVGILSNSPAKTVGIKVDDIILAIDGMMIRDIDTLTSYLGENKSPAEVVTIKLRRDTTEVELSLQVGRRP